MVNTLVQIVTKPSDFFESIATKSVDLKRAFMFAGANLLIWGVVSLVINFILGPSLGSHINSPFSLVVNLFFSLILMPVAAVIFMLVSMLLGGKAEFFKCLEVCCYITAISAPALAIMNIPSVGAYLAILPYAYSMYALAVASIKVCSVQVKRAYIFCSVVCFLLVFSVISSQMAMNKMGREFENLTKSSGLDVNAMMKAAQEAAKEMEKAGNRAELDAAKHEIENERTPSKEE